MQTIKLPSDLRVLKMNLPSSKYDDFKPPFKETKRLSNDKYDIKNYASDRPSYINFQKQNGVSP